MANELLDFVMSLARDPDAAARYAADPAQVIADAHLSGVTSADVSNLLPMVSDSLSMAAPAFGAKVAGDGNVWTSGAATAAFDAFTPHSVVPAHSVAGVIDTSLPAVNDTAGVGASPDHAAAFDSFGSSTQLSGMDAAQGGVDDAAGLGDQPADWADWHHPVSNHQDPHEGQHGSEHSHPGF